MRHLKTILAASALGLAVGAAPASASPLGSQLGGLSTSATAAPHVIQVRNGRKGAAIAAGVAGVIGGIIASQARPRYYDEPEPVYVERPDYDPDVAYCIRHYKSYDIESGTYLGYDGYRHPCP